MARSFKRPDEAAMQRVFARTSGGAAEVVLRLAWLQGLHRAEITALRWDQVDFGRQGAAAAGSHRSSWIRLRKPASGSGMCAAPDNPERVAVSDRGQTPMRPESVSRLARQALNSEGQTAESAWICATTLSSARSRTMAGHYAAQVSGVAVSALRDDFLPLPPDRQAPSPAAPTADRDEREYLLWRIVQQEGSSPAGLAHVDGLAGCGCSPARLPR